MLQLLQDDLQLVDFASERGGGAAVVGKQSSRLNANVLFPFGVSSSGFVILVGLKKKKHRPKGQ